MTIHNRGDLYAANGIIAKDTASSVLTAYVALFTSVPTDTNASTAEVRGNGYSRQSVNLRRNTSTDRIENDTSTVTFSFTGSVSNIRYAAICDSSTRGTNDLIWSGSITSTSVSSGSTITFGTDAITLAFS